MSFQALAVHFEAATPLLGIKNRDIYPVLQQEAPSAGRVETVFDNGFAEEIMPELNSGEIDFGLFADFRELFSYDIYSLWKKYECEEMTGPGMSGLKAEAREEVLTILGYKMGTLLDSGNDPNAITILLANLVPYMTPLLHDMRIDATREEFEPTTETIHIFATKYIKNLDKKSIPISEHTSSELQKKYTHEEAKLKSKA